MCVPLHFVGISRCFRFIIENTSSFEMDYFTTINMKLLLKYLIDNHIFCNFAAEN